MEKAPQNPGGDRGIPGAHDYDLYLLLKSLSRGLSEVFSHHIMSCVQGSP